jgi:hypothetical protein
MATNGMLQDKLQSQAITLDSDSNGLSYRAAVAKLNESYALVSNTTVSKSTAEQQIRELNKALSRVDKSRLEPGEKEKVDALQAQYQALIFEQFQPIPTASDTSENRNIQKSFYSSYAMHLALDGQRLTTSVDVIVKFDGGRVLVLRSPDASASARHAADFAFEDLRASGTEVSYVNDRSTKPDY